jgi:hypothetical protein
MLSNSSRRHLHCYSYLHVLADDPLTPHSVYDLDGAARLADRGSKSGSTTARISIRLLDLFSTV